MMGRSEHTVGGGGASQLPRRRGQTPPTPVERGRTRVLAMQQWPRPPPTPAHRCIPLPLRCTDSCQPHARTQPFQRGSLPATALSQRPLATATGNSGASRAASPNGHLLALRLCAAIHHGDFLRKDAEVDGGVFTWWSPMCWLLFHVGGGNLTGRLPLALTPTPADPSLSIPPSLPPHNASYPASLTGMAA